MRSHLVLVREGLVKQEEETLQEASHAKRSSMLKLRFSNW